VEYQRSHESYEKFCARDDLRRSEKWVDVDWWFDDSQNDPEIDRATVYRKSQPHRTHLALLGVFFYRCWVDPQTLKLQAEYGRSGELPPHRTKRICRHMEKAALVECSIAETMRQIEDGPEREIIKPYKKPLEAIPGSVLDFKRRTDWSLEKEKKVAEAVLRRQKRLEEQDRRHREWEAKQKRLEEERQELERIEREKAQEEQRIAAEKLAEEIKKRQLEEEEEREKQRVYRERIKAELEEEKAKRQRELEEEEKKWGDIEFTEPVSIRGRLHRFAKNLKVGDLIRQNPWLEPEVYKGRSSTGYSTHLHTYRSLEGWQVKK